MAAVCQPDRCGLREEDFLSLYDQQARVAGLAPESEVR